MSRELDRCRMIERSLQKRFRRPLWSAFTAGLKRYALIGAGEGVAAVVDGSAASVLLAKLIQQLERYSAVPFRAVYLGLDDGTAACRALLDAAAALALPLRVVPREAVPEEAARLGCDKLALPHCRDDVVEALTASMLEEGRLRGLLPMEGGPSPRIIRPRYLIERKDILAWRHYNQLAFPEAVIMEPEAVLRARALLTRLRKDNPNVDNNLFSSVHAVCLDTFPGWSFGGQLHDFLEDYDRADPPSVVFRCP